MVPARTAADADANGGGGNESRTAMPHSHQQANRHRDQTSHSEDTPHSDKCSMFNPNSVFIHTWFFVVRELLLHPLGAFCMPLEPPSIYIMQHTCLIHLFRFCLYFQCVLEFSVWGLAPDKGLVCLVNLVRVRGVSTERDIWSLRVFACWGLWCVAVVGSWRHSQDFSG